MLPRFRLGLRSRNSVLGILALAAGAGQALAADITADLRIDRVTVYRQGAVVTREGEVAVPAGSNRLIVRGVPAGIDSKTLRVTIEGGSVQLGGVEITQINEGNFVSEAERELRRKIELMGDQRGAVQDAIATEQTQLKLLDALAANPAGSTTRPAAVDAPNLASILATMSTSANGARKRMRDAAIQLRTIDHELERLKADLGKVATHSKQSTEVRVGAEANSAAIAKVAVAYTVADAGWDWIYQARLDTGKRRISLDRQGSAQQGSGEDWKGVELTLTTALPAADVATPVLGSLLVDLRAPEPAAKSRQVDALMGGVVVGAAQAPAPVGDLEEIAVTGARRPAAASSTDYVAEYKIPSRVSLLADREPRLYPIAEDGFDVDLVARVVPSASRAAHLEAVFKYQEQLPIEAGQLQLYRDGDYVGAADIPAFLPGAEVRMPFGSDERIRIAIRDEQAQSGQRGLINKQTIKETRQRFNVTSYHPTPISVEIVNRIPVSRNSDIHVEVLKGATEPSARDFEGKPGVFLWRLDAQPQKTISVRHYYSIQYPSGRQLEQSEMEATE